MSDPAVIKESLVRQLMAPVQWIKTVGRMDSDGYQFFVEVGPGKVLSGLIRKIVPEAQVANAGDPESIASILNS